MSSSDSKSPDWLRQAFLLLDSVESELCRIQSSYRDFKYGEEELFCLLFVFRAIRGLRAIRILCEAGLASEAEMILRSMLEDVVTLNYVLVDFSTRIARWAAHCKSRHAYYTDIAIRFGRFEDVRQRRALEARLESFGGVPPRSRRDRWDVGFLAMARDVSSTPGGEHFAAWFEALYAPLCDVAHGYAPATFRYRRNHRDDAPVICSVLGRAVFIVHELAEGFMKAGLKVQRDTWVPEALEVLDRADAGARQTEQRDRAD